MGDRDEEFGAFIRNCATPLHQTAYLLCGDWHLAHDLVQDTLVKAYQHWPRVRRADSPNAYVRAILVNEARGRWRRQGMTQRETAAALGCSEGTVKSQSARALGNLRTYLDRTESIL
jgi:DNA-directed RNA polymerase specialized sigma24 family protein